MTVHSSLLRRLDSGGHPVHVTMTENGKMHMEKRQTSKQSQYYKRLKPPTTRKINGKGGKIASHLERDR